MRMRGILFGAVVLLSACNYNEVKNRGGSTPPEKLSTDLGFDEVRAAVFQESCNGCHAEFANYAAVKAAAADIRARVASDNMPQGGPPLSPELKNMLFEWIDSGAPEQGTQPAPAPAPQPEPEPAPRPEPQPVPQPEPRPEPQPDDEFSTVHAEVITPFCMRCHAQATERNNFVSLADFAAIWPNLQRIRDAVTSGQMPPRGTLPADKRAQLIDWIDKRLNPEASGRVQ